MESKVELLLIQNLVTYVDSEDNLKKIVSAKINGEQHCTGDVRHIGGRWWSVFSDLTKDGVLYESVSLCMRENIYKEVPISYKKFQIDHYIWIEINLNGKEYE